MGGVLIAWSHATLLAPIAGCAVRVHACRDAQNSGNFHPGDVNQSVPPPVSQKAQLPPLDLTDDQRAQIKHVLMTQNTEVTFQLKTTKPAKSFDPTVGAKIPNG